MASENPHGESVEIRPFHELEDFGEAVTDEFRERQARMEATIEEQKRDA